MTTILDREERNDNKNTRALNAIIIILGCISLLNIVFVITSNETIYPNYLSLIVSLLGLTAAALYFMKNKAYARLFIIWGILQPLVFTRYIPYGSEMLEAPLYNVYQFQWLKFTLYIQLTTDAGIISIGIEPIALLFIAAARFIYISSLFGTTVHLRPLKADSYLTKHLPANVTIERKVALNDKKTWLLVRIDKPNGPVYGLVRHKDDERITPGKKKQILQFLEVPDVSKLQAINSRSDFSNGDWVVMN